MKTGESTMKLLQIDDNQGFFLDKNDKLLPVSKLDKNHLLWLVNQTLDANVEVTFDAFDPAKLRNQAHQIIYKSVYDKLTALREQRKDFVDTSERLYLTDYEKYREAK
jgi:hypothetical protein